MFPADHFLKMLPPKGTVIMPFDGHVDKKARINHESKYSNQHQHRFLTAPTRFIYFFFFFFHSRTYARLIDLNPDPFVFCRSHYLLSKYLPRPNDFRRLNFLVERFSRRRTNAATFPTCALPSVVGVLKYISLPQHESFYTRNVLPIN